MIIRFLKTKSREIGRVRMEDPMDMAHAYASFDYERRRPTREVKMTEQKLKLIRCGGGL